MCTSDSIGVISLAKPTRKGFLQKYKKRFIGSNWRKVWVVLHEDSSLEWYYDEVENDFEGGITLKESPEMIAAGPYANYVPNKPELPKGADPNSLMAFGNKTKDRVHWFMAANLDDLNQWMTAISNTLPPPPQVPPAATTKNSDGEDLRPPPYNPSPTAPPLPQQSNGFAQQRRPPYPYRDGYGRGGYGGGGYGGGNYGGGGYGSPTGGGQNTVIIDRGSNNNMGNFATGMFMGAALTGWGCGLGWGIGPFMGGFGGWGFGYGFGGPRLGYNDTDINITNNYNTTNNTTNNPSEETNGNSNPPEADPAPENGAPEAEVDPEEAEVDPEEAQVDPDSGVDPGLDEGVDPNGFEPGFEPDAEYFNDSGIDPGLMDGGDFGRMEMGGGGEYGMEDMGGSFDMGGFDLGGFDMGGFDMGGFDVGGMDF